MTGVACPPGTEAIVPKEQIHREGGADLLPTDNSPQENITSPDSECSPRQRSQGRPNPRFQWSAAGCHGQEPFDIERSPHVYAADTSEMILRALDSAAD